MGCWVGEPQSSRAGAVAFSRGSELEAAVRSKQEALKELEAEESVDCPRRKAELHVEDLRETPQAVSKAGRESVCLVRSERVTALKTQLWLLLCEAS